MSETLVEEKLVEALTQFRLKCTFAVTPYFADVGAVRPGQDLRITPVPREKCGMLKRLAADGSIEIALHGYSHLCTSRLRSMAEFSAAMPVAQQRALLRAGRDYLEEAFGVRIVTFVPPWNLCGTSTLRALCEEGFTTLSAALPLAFSSTCATDGFPGELSYMPANAAASKAPATIALAKRIDSRDAFVSFVLHDYDFAESRYATTAGALSDVLAYFGEIAREPSVETVRASDAGSLFPDKLERFRSNLAFGQAVWRSALRRKLAAGMADVYWSSKAAARMTSLVQWLP